MHPRCPSLKVVDGVGSLVRYVKKGNFDTVGSIDMYRQVCAVRSLLADIVQGITEEEPDFLPKADVDRLMALLSIEPIDVSVPTHNQNP